MHELKLSFLFQAHHSEKSLGEGVEALAKHPEVVSYAAAASKQVHHILPDSYAVLTSRELSQDEAADLVFGSTAVKFVPFEQALEWVHGLNGGTTVGMVGDRDRIWIDRLSEHLVTDDQVAWAVEAAAELVRIEQTVEQLVRALEGSGGGLKPPSTLLYRRLTQRRKELRSGIAAIG